MGTSKNLLWNSGVDIFFRYEALKTSLTGLSEYFGNVDQGWSSVNFAKEGKKLTEVAVKKIKPETE